MTLPVDHRCPPDTPRKEELKGDGKNKLRFAVGAGSGVIQIN